MNGELLLVFFMKLIQWQLQVVRGAYNNNFGRE